MNAHQQTDFVCSLAGFTHRLCALCHRGSRSNWFLPISIKVYLTSWFNTRNPTCTWGANIISSCFGREGKWKSQTQECWLGRMMFLSLAGVLFGDFASHFLPTRRTNLIFTNGAARKKIQSWTSVVLLACVALERKQIRFIRTRHMRIYVVIEAEVKIFSTPADWFSFLLETDLILDRCGGFSPHGCLRNCT